MFFLAKWTVDWLWGYFTGRSPGELIMTSTALLVAGASAIYLYRLAFDFNDFGGAAAMSWVLCGVVVVMTLLTNRAFKER